MVLGVILRRSKFPVTHVLTRTVPSIGFDRYRNCTKPLSVPSTVGHRRFINTKRITGDTVKLAPVLYPLVKLRKLLIVAIIGLAIVYEEEVRGSVEEVLGSKSNNSKSATDNPSVRGISESSS